MSKRTPTVTVQLASKDVRSQLGRNILAHKIGAALDMDRKAILDADRLIGDQPSSGLRSKPTQKPLGKSLPANFRAPGAKPAKPAKTARPRELTPNQLQNAAQERYDAARSNAGRRLVSKREMRRAQRDADVRSANAGTI
jgi:hypothetical protein